MFGGIEAGAGNNGRLTFPANLHGNPAISIPAGSLDGLPIGLQVVGRHYSEQLLLDLALIVERNRRGRWWRRARPMTTRGSPGDTQLTREQRTLAVGMVLGVTMVAFEITAVITALPTITDELGGDTLVRRRAGRATPWPTWSPWWPPANWPTAAARRGRSSPASPCSSIGLVVAGAAPTWLVVTGRVLQGAGIGGLAPIAYVAVKRAFPDDGSRSCTPGCPPAGCCPA